MSADDKATRFREGYIARLKAELERAEQEVERLRADLREALHVINRENDDRRYCIACGRNITTNKHWATCLIAKHEEAGE